MVRMAVHSALQEQSYNKAPEEDTLLTVPEAAKFLGVVEGTVYNMVNKGVLPFMKPNGKTLYFSKAALLEWINGDRKQITAEKLPATTSDLRRSRQKKGGVK